MTLDKTQLVPLEGWLKERSKDQNNFPQGSGDCFDRYWQIKTYLDKKVYNWIGAGTSAEDQGVYTDHSIDHFNAVIKYAGKLLGTELPVDSKEEEFSELKLNPYEVFILLVSILLHDAGNIYGRQGHATKALKIFKDMGSALCPDEFEAMFIAKIAEVHGGESLDVNGCKTKDTIRNANLEKTDSYGGKKYRPSLIAAIVRFSDEICEDRSRSAVLLISNQALPSESEIYHRYANAISSVDVDIDSKYVSIKYQLKKSDVLKKIGENSGKRYLIDEIISRLEKMYCELCYCKPFMLEVVPINRIRAAITIHDDESGCELLIESFELCESGYPSQTFLFKKSYPDWSGAKIKNKIKNNGTD